MMTESEMQLCQPLCYDTSWNSVFLGHGQTPNQVVARRAQETVIIVSQNLKDACITIWSVRIVIHELSTSPIERPWAGDLNVRNRMDHQHCKYLALGTFVIGAERLHN